MLKNMYQKTKDSINRQQSRFNEKKTVGLGLQLFFLYLIHSMLHALALLFTSPEKCFVMATNQDPRGTWSKSYYQHLLFQRRIRLYSVTSFFTIIIAVLTASLAFNIIFPPTEIKFAQAATTYTVSNTNDSGNGSLRWAMANAGTGDTIDATSITGTITLNSPLTFSVNGVTLNSNENLNIEGASAAPSVIISGMENISIDSLIINNAGGAGFKLSSYSTGISITNCTVSSPTTSAIILVDSDDNTIEDCTITTPGARGILLDGSDSNIISNNTIGGTTQDGIRLNNGSTLNTISSNAITLATLRGIAILGSSESNTIEGNSINHNTLSGIKIDSSDNNIISNNTSTSNGRRGLAIRRSSGSTVTDNSFSSNGNYGIMLSKDAYNNTFSSNIISNNITAGAYIYSGNTGNYFYHNTVVTQDAYIVSESSAESTLATAVRSEETQKLYLDFTSDNDVATGQVALGTMEGGFADYADDIILTFNTYQDTVDLTEDLSTSYFQACVLPSDGNSTTYNEACLEITEDVEAPNIDIANSGNTITLSATDDTDSNPLIYYTIDGTDPTTSSTTYTSPFTVASGTLVKAIAVDWVDNYSEIETLEIEVDEEDVTAPVISNISASVTATTATITWTTNELATSVIRYGKNEDNLANSLSDTTLITSHSIEIIGLDSETKYYYRVRSADSSDNEGLSEIKNFTTLADTAPVILDPEEGDVVYTQKPTISGTAPSEAKLKLYMDAALNNEGQADENGEFSIQAKKLTADEHTARVKNKDTNERSSRVTFTVATTETTKDILLTGDFKNTANTTNELRPNLVGNIFINSYSVDDFTVRVFIDEQAYALADLADTTSDTASFVFQPDSKLDPGTHEVYFKVLRNGELITTSETRTFYVNGHPAPTLSYSKDKVLINSLSEDIVRLYLNDEDYKEIILDPDDSGVSGSILDVSILSPGTYTMYGTARSEDVSPESKKSDTITFTINAPVADAPTTPVVEDEEVEEEEEVIIETPEEKDTDEDGVPDMQEEEQGTDISNPDTDGDGWTDKEEEVLGQDPTVAEKDLIEEEVIVKKQIILEDLASEEEIPSQYPLIGEQVVDMTDQEVKQIKEEAIESAKESVFAIQTDGVTQEAIADSITGQTTISLPKVVDLGDSFREAFGGQTSEQTTSDIVLSGVAPIITGADTYVILTVKSDPIVRIAEADENGQWTLSVPVDYLPEGDHTAYLQTEVNGVQTEQVQIARFVLQEQERFSNTTIFFLANIALAIFVLLLAIFLQLRKNRKLIEEMEQQA